MCGCIQSKMSRWPDDVCLREFTAIGDWMVIWFSCSLSVNVLTNVDELFKDKIETEKESKPKEPEEQDVIK
ncbi:hypothetical protein Hdeb2414_s0009g00316961 [Helianthus debilis subsp. tardiflorus]